MDSSYLIALTDKRDKFNSKAVDLAKKITSGAFGSIIVSDYVFDETVTFIANRQGFIKAIEWGKSILNCEIEFMHVSEEIFQKAWQLFQERKNLSFTDCTIVELIKAEKVKQVASFDAGFRQFKEIQTIN